MISICIPTYEQRNHGALMLTKLLQSITWQKFNGPFEVLISDNATDGSIKKVCDLFPQLPISYHFNPVRGASENINNAIDLAKYDKIKLMMQDDMFADPLALQRYSDALDKYGWVISDSNHINANGIRTGQRVAEYRHGNFDQNTIGMPSVIAFRKCELRFMPELKTFCDLYFYYQLYQQYGQPFKIPGFNVSQRFHPASLSRNQPGSHKQDKHYLLSKGLIPGSTSKVVVAVIVYNRYDNINRWIECWQRCDTKNAELVIIMNNDNWPMTPEAFYQKQYAGKDIQFISRKNIGYDIGAFQDVCRNRLPGFPDYDYLLWCTDDTIPMSKDFIQQFILPFDSSIGVTCMQISDEYTRHIRTTGFCLPKKIVQKLKFPADPITTVQECWHFEHRGLDRTLLRQIVRMKLRAWQVAPLDQSPLYDTGFWYRNEGARKVAHLHDRMNEHNKIFPTLEQITSNV